MPIKNTKVKKIQSSKQKYKIHLAKFLLPIIALVIVCWFFYPKFAIWDASNPHDDESFINKILLPFTPTVTPQTVEQAFKQDPNIIIIDVRSKEEYDRGHIPGAVLVPEETLYEDIKYVVPDKTAVIYLYCHSGHRGAVSTRLLKTLGYQNAFNIKDGLTGWEKATFSVQK